MHDVCQKRKSTYTVDIIMINKNVDLWTKRKCIK